MRRRCQTSPWGVEGARGRGAGTEATLNCRGYGFDELIDSHLGDPLIARRTLRNMLRPGHAVDDVEDRYARAQGSLTLNANTWSLHGHT